MIKRTKLNTLDKKCIRLYLVKKLKNAEKNGKKGYILIPFNESDHWQGKNPANRVDHKTQYDCGLWIEIRVLLAWLDADTENRYDMVFTDECKIKTLSRHPRKNNLPTMALVKVGELIPIASANDDTVTALERETIFAEYTDGTVIGHTVDSDGNKKPTKRVLDVVTATTGTEVKGPSGKCRAKQ